MVVEAFSWCQQQTDFLIYSKKSKRLPVGFEGRAKGKNLVFFELYKIYF